MIGIKTTSVKGPTKDLAPVWNVRRGYGGEVKTIMLDTNG